MPRKRTRDQDGIFARPDSPKYWRSTTRRPDPDQDQGGKGAVGTASRPAAHRRIVRRGIWSYLRRADARLSGSSDRAQEGPDRDHTSAKQLYPVFSGRLLEGLRVADARAYVARRQAAGAAAGTINKEVGLFSAALNWSRRELEWKVPNPFQGRRLREPPGRSRWLTRAEAAALLRATEAVKQAPHLADFIRLGLYTGMRSGEILGLEWRRIDL